jgi:acyl-coenzyme A synthetase/AMP-(fatty) acid ligase
MMWNFLVSSLLLGVRPVLYDGNPAYPRPDILWQLVQDAGVTFFGASPAYVEVLSPGVWRQGDFFRVNARGGCFVLGRSDATLNRDGVRIGTPADAAANRSAMANPASLDVFVGYARTQRDYRLG